MNIYISVSQEAFHLMEECTGETGFQQAPRRHRIKAVEAEQRELGQGRSLQRGGPFQQANWRGAGGGRNFRLVEMAYANAPRHSRNKLRSPGLYGYRE